MIDKQERPKAYSQIFIIIALLCLNFGFSQVKTVPNNIEKNGTGDSVQALKKKSEESKIDSSKAGEKIAKDSLNKPVSNTSETTVEQKKAPTESLNDSVKVSSNTNSTQNEVQSSELHPLDRPKVNKNRRASKDAWEHIVSSPGYLINAVLWPLNKGIEGTIYFIDENKIVPKVKRILISKDGSRVIMPAFNSQIGAGVKVTKEGLGSPNSMLVLGANHGFDPRRGAKLYFLDWAPVKMLELDFKTEYQNLFESKFFGVGPDSKSGGESSYLNTQVESGLELKFKMTKSFSLKVGGAHLFHNIEDGEKSEEPLLNFYPEIKANKFGFEENLNLGEFGGGIEFNTIDPPGHPLRGFGADISFKLYKDFSHDDYNFWKAEADLKQYIHLFYDRSLMLRFNSSIMRTYSDGAIPFYHMSELGETGTIRGFDRGRFRDRDRIFGTVEYRYPIWSPEYRVIEMVVFGDMGQVTRDVFTKFDWERMNYGYGFGIRGYSAKNRVLSLEFGFSEELFRVYFILN